MKTDLSNRRLSAFTLFPPLAMALAALLVTTLPAPADGGNPNPGILPPDSTPYGHSYGEWAARWWQWGLSIPKDRNPLTDSTGQFCDEGQSGPVWFRGGLATSGERVCSLPPGKAIFMPVFNWIFGASVYDCDPTVPGVPCDVETLRAAAAAATEAATVLDVTIDGVPVENVRDYRASSPEPFSITLPENGIVPGVAAGTYAPQVADGYWLMLAPLSKGTHTIRVHVVSPGAFDFTSVTHLTVE